MNGWMEGRGGGQMTKYWRINDIINLQIQCRNYSAVE